MKEQKMIGSDYYTVGEALEITQNFVSRKLENILQMIGRALEIALILVWIATIIALFYGLKVLKEADEVLAACNSNEQHYPYEDMSVDEWFRNMMDSKEVPPRLLTDNLTVEDIEEVEEVSKKYTQADIELLAQLMYAEEGIFFRQYSENPEKVEKVHKLAGSVVIHRAEIGYRGETTIEGTIYCRGQYAQQTLDRVTEGQDIPEIVYTWAEELLAEGALGPRGMIYQAEFEQGDETYDQIGNQYFCIETKYNN